MRVDPTRSGGLRPQRLKDGVLMKRLIPLGCLLILAACGGGGSSTTTTPTTPTQANRNPAITAMNFSPTFGIASLTRFDYSASASDLDGDTLTFTWSLAGSAASGSSGSITFAPPGR